MSQSTKPTKVPPTARFILLAKNNEEYRLVSKLDNCTTSTCTKCRLPVIMSIFIFSIFSFFHCTLFCLTTCNLQYSEALTTIQSFRQQQLLHRRVSKKHIHSTSRELQLSAASSDNNSDGSKRRRPTPKPILSKDWPQKFPAKEHCSKCGLCESTFVQHVKDSCAFLDEGMGRIESLEKQVHGRSRLRTNVNSDLTEKEQREEIFGVLHQDYPVLLAKGTQSNAQWTGLVTSIAVSMLEERLVDAVVCIASKSIDDDQDDDYTDERRANLMPRMEPQPIVARTPQEILRGRGVKPSLAPSLRVLDEIKQDPSIKRLLFCGVGCAVQAFRSPKVQEDLGLEDVFVLGTNCVDNSPSPRASQNFISEGLKVEEKDLGTVTAYEFMQDFQVHVKRDDNAGDVRYDKIPYFSLPGKVAKSSIAESCLACFDYTNALADVVVGYMGAPLDDGSGSGKDKPMDQALQTLTVRNEKGREMVEVALGKGRVNLFGEAPGTGNWEEFAVQTVASDGIVAEMVGGKPKEEGMPRFLGGIVAKILTGMGPKGMNFASYSIDYHILRNYLHIIDVWGEEKAGSFLPQYSKDIVEGYLNRSKEFRDLKESVVLQGAKK